MSGSVAEALAAARVRLASAGDSPALDAEVLLAHLLGRSRTWLRAFGEQPLTPQQAQAYDALLARRAAGVPVAYLTGRREFWSLDLAVTPDTLVPRPETELLVQALLERLPAAPVQRVADLGTGSGAVALAIASERPHWQVVATDASAAALAVARGNAGRLGLGNVEFVQGDWCESLAGERFHALVSNPPYVPAADPHLREGDVVHEPDVALTPGPEGLEAIRRIVAQAPAVLHSGGWLLLEHGFDQADVVAVLLAEAGFRERVMLLDGGGRPRVSGGITHRNRGN